jgi:hypothetical protein
VNCQTASLPGAAEQIGDADDELIQNDEEDEEPVKEHMGSHSVLDDSRQQSSGQERITDSGANKKGATRSII